MANDLIQVVSNSELEGSIVCYVDTWQDDVILRHKEMEGRDELVKKALIKFTTA